MGEEDTRGLLNEQETSDEQLSTITDLPVNLLLWEIFHRLHSPRDLIRCMTVCRHWNSLIGSPEFYYVPGFALIINTPAPNQSLNEPHYATEERTFNDWEGFKLKYLPCFNKRYKHPVCVQASCTDLLLCTKSYKTQSVFYVVNPYIMQWTQLPRTHRGKPKPIGLVARLEEAPHKYRYKVVRMTGIHDIWFRFEEFDSETCCWSVKFIRHLPSKPSNWCSLPRYQGLAFNGSLHWLAKDGTILAYDPFDHHYICKFIGRSKGMSHNRYKNATVTECLTTSRGHLWMVQLVFFCTSGVYGNEAHHLCIWKLEDYEQTKWGIKYRLYFKDMVCDIPWLRDYMHEFIQEHIKYKCKMTDVKKLCAWLCQRGIEYPEKGEVIHTPEPLACHPTKTHIVYLHLPCSIVSCDLLTRKLEIISKISTQLEPYHYDTVIPITLQSRPIPVPSLT